MEGLLKELEVGDTAEVLGYRGENSTYRQQLLAMGLTPRVLLTIVKVAPLGDPVEIELRGFRLTLRKSEADALVIRRVGGGLGRRRRWRGGRGGEPRGRSGR